MKKLFAPALCLGLLLTSAVSLASVNSLPGVYTPAADDDKRQAIKPEELPEPIKKTLATDTYKDWTVKEASLVSRHPSPETMATADAGASYYEVTLTKDKENKIFKFHKDGTLLK